MASRQWTVGAILLIAFVGLAWVVGNCFMSTALIGLPETPPSKLPSDEGSSADQDGQLIDRRIITPDNHKSDSDPTSITGRLITQIGKGEQVRRVPYTGVVITRRHEGLDFLELQTSTDGNGEGSFTLLADGEYLLRAEAEIGVVFIQIKLPASQELFDNIYEGVIQIDFIQDDAFLVFRIADPAFEAVEVSLLANYSTLPKRRHWFQDGLTKIVKEASDPSFNDTIIPVRPGMFVHWACYDSLGQSLVSGITDRQLRSGERIVVDVILPMEGFRRVTITPRDSDITDRKDQQVWVLSDQGWLLTTIRYQVGKEFSIKVPVDSHLLLVSGNSKTMREPFDIPLGSEDLHLTWTQVRAGRILFPRDFLKGDQAIPNNFVVRYSYSRQDFIGTVRLTEDGQYYELQGGWVDGRQVFRFGDRYYSATVQEGETVVFPSPGVQELGNSELASVSFAIDFNGYPVEPVTVEAFAEGVSIVSQSIRGSYGTRRFPVSIQVPDIPLRIVILIGSDVVWSGDFLSPKSIPSQISVR